jgi:FdhE protein
MNTIDHRLKDLERRRPEWAPWLAVMGELLDEIEDPGWDAAVPLGTLPLPSQVPLLAKARLKLDERVVVRIFENLMGSAGRSGTPEMGSLQTVPCAKLGFLGVFRAALNQDSDGLKAYASAACVDPDAFRAVAALAPMPFLHACNRLCGAAVSESWIEGYCPVCGAWPAFADVRGIERARYFRCGRCGAAWQARCLFCPYCGMTDHEELATLVPEQSRSKGVIDACNRCLGYVKALTTLQGSAAATVILDDAASVELDLAALEHGYKRPPGAGYTLDVAVADDAAWVPFA